MEPQAAELRDLYQEVILDHGRRPRNRHSMEAPSAVANGDNPMCGDQMTVFLRLDDNGHIADISFEGRGCAISMASASLMTELLKGRTRDEAEALFRDFRAMCTGAEVPEAAPEDALERLSVLSGVKDFPSRVKCATLAWHTMDAALAGHAETVTTE